MTAPLYTASPKFGLYKRVRVVAFKTPYNQIVPQVRKITRFCLKGITKNVVIIVYTSSNSNKEDNVPQQEFCGDPMPVPIKQRKGVY